MPLTITTKSHSRVKRVQTLYPGRRGPGPGHWEVRNGAAVHVGKAPGRKPYSPA